MDAAPIVPTKKYIDEVFAFGHGKLYANVGRSRHDASKNTAPAACCKAKSICWNAPLETFTEPEQFFNGTGVDNVYMHFHYANECLGMSALPIFLCNDVIKAPDVPK